MTNYSRSVLKSNGLRRQKIRLKKFGFSSKTVPANIVQKVTVTTLFQTVPHRIFQPLAQTAHVYFRGRKWVTHSAFGERSHTRAHTAKQGPSLPRPQRGLVLPAISLLFRHAFIYIHFPVLCEPSLSATALSQTIFHRVFQLLAQTAHVCFRG